ncbi:hypothetical protein PHMEG_00029989 [Phytophthora megakarya]|uniref:Uncharacterized protein n=1 Tax=Phytophthora megakarya TaxID=4795 RepID=A0A225V3U6_9STRA|nr:hypothetical protein PHMEG_00029989 [Phytophthora megakarya]
MKEVDRSGELLALCYRGQWPKAAEILHDENLTEVLLFLMANAPRELMKINTSMQKDGKTLLHLALESNNLRFIYELLSAGADVTVADKKGVKPMDIMTWTAVVHPTIMAPLQDNILHLQQQNELRRECTSALDKITNSLQCDEQSLLTKAGETKDDVSAAQTFRAEIDEQIRRAEVTDRELTTCIEAEEVKLQWIREEVARLHTQNGTADQEVAEINEETEKLVAASAALRTQHDIQTQGRDKVAAQCAIKCEMIGMLRQFPGNEALQTRALRALLIMLLTSTMTNSYGLAKWRTKELVEELLVACTLITADSPPISDQVYRTTADVYNCLGLAPQLNDTDRKSKWDMRDCGWLSDIANNSVLL